MGIAEIIALLTTLAPLARDGIAYWTKAKETLSQSSEWTPEYEATIDAEIEKIRTNPEPFQQQQPL